MGNIKSSAYAASSSFSGVFFLSVKYMYCPFLKTEKIIDSQQCTLKVDFHKYKK